MGSKKKNKQKKIQTPKETPEILWPSTFRITARNLSSRELAGVIFGCKHGTMQECFAKQLFGLPSSHFVYIRNIKPGLPLFLFNYSDRKLHGIFEATSAGRMNISPLAWSSEREEPTPFPAQVRFQIKMRCQPLNEDQFKLIISANYFEEKYFWNELDSVQTKNLILLFRSLPRAATASSNKSNSVPTKLSTQESKQEHFASDNVTLPLRLKDNWDSEAEDGIADEACEKGGQLKIGWTRSFASVVSSSSLQKAEMDDAEKSISRTDFAEAEAHSTGCGSVGNAPEWIGETYIKSNKEKIGYSKQEGGHHFDGSRRSYSSIVKDTINCPKADTCNTTTPASGSSLSDQQNLKQDSYWGSPSRDHENYSAHVNDEICSSYTAIEEYAQVKTMLNSDNVWDDSSCESECALLDGGKDRHFVHEERLSTQSPRISQTNSVEYMKSISNLQDDISDQPVEWSSLWNEIELDSRRILQVPSTEILKGNKNQVTMHSKMDNGHKYGSASCRSQEKDVVFENTFSNCKQSKDDKAGNWYSTPVPENGAEDNFEEVEYLTASSELFESASMTIDESSEYSGEYKERNSEGNKGECFNDSHASIRFDFADVHCVNRVIPKLLQAVESLKVSQMVQAQQIHFLVQDLAIFKEESRELKERINALELSSSPALPAEKIKYQMFTESEKNVNEYIFLIGGFDGSSWISSVDCYVPSSDVKISLSPMSSMRSSAAATKLNGEIYVFGGKDIDSNWCCSTVESYSPLSNQWVKRPPLNQRKKGLTGVSAYKKLFAIGGVDEMSECFADVEMYEQDLGRWIPIKSMRHKRVDSAAAEISGIIYAVGGSDGKNYLKSVERYDPREDSWNLIKSMRTPRGGHSLAVLNDKLFALGGYDGGRVVSSVEVFDPRKGEWMSGEPMKSCRGYAGAAVIGQSVYVMGGAGNSNKMLETVECYTEQQGWQITGLKSIGKRCSFSAVVL
uniref:DCD domain-containing protein n=1 Tax=Kalanchoe fedtschenkoi TaxID=63787 RepID=A0A7N0UHE9_KALFE